MSFLPWCEWVREREVKREFFFPCSRFKGPNWELNLFAPMLFNYLFSWVCFLAPHSCLRQFPPETLYEFSECFMFKGSHRHVSTRCTSFVPSTSQTDSLKMWLPSVTQPKVQSRRTKKSWFFLEFLKWRRQTFANASIIKTEWSLNGCKKTLFHLLKLFPDHLWEWAAAG